MSIVGDESGCAALLFASTRGETSGHHIWRSIDLRSVGPHDLLIVANRTEWLVDSSKKLLFVKKLFLEATGREHRSSLAKPYPAFGAHRTLAEACTRETEPSLWLARRCSRGRLARPVLSCAGLTLLEERLISAWLDKCAKANEVRGQARTPRFCRVGGKQGTSKGLAQGPLCSVTASRRTGPYDLNADPHTWPQHRFCGLDAWRHHVSHALLLSSPG